MLEKNFTVTVDVAGAMSAKIKAVAAEYEGKYTLDDGAYNRVLNACKMFRKFALQNDGGIKIVDVYGVGEAKMIAEVPVVDLFRDGLDSFMDLLTIVDSFGVSVSKEGDLIIEIGVTGLWKAV